MIVLNPDILSCDVIDASGISREACAEKYARRPRAILQLCSVFSYIFRVSNLSRWNTPVELEKLARELSKQVEFHVGELISSCILYREDVPLCVRVALLKPR